MGSPGGDSLDICLQHYLIELREWSWLYQMPVIKQFQNKDSYFCYHLERMRTFRYYNYIKLPCWHFWFSCKEWSPWQNKWSIGFAQLVSAKFRDPQKNPPFQSHQSPRFLFKYNGVHVFFLQKASILPFCPFFLSTVTQVITSGWSSTIPRIDANLAR